MIMPAFSTFKHVANTVEPVLNMLKECPIGNENIVSQDRWYLVTGSFTLKCIILSANNWWSFKADGL